MKAKANGIARAKDLEMTFDKIMKRDYLYHYTVEMMSKDNGFLIKL